MNVTLTTWAHAKAPEDGQEKTVTWEGLAAEYLSDGSKVKPKDKLRAPSFCTVRPTCKSGECDRAKSRPLKRHRCKKSTLSVTALILDYDGKQHDWSQTVDRLKKRGLASLVYDTPSSTSDAPKWRLCIPITEPWTNVDAWDGAYKRFRSHFEELLGVRFDDKTCDPCRIFYPPTRQTEVDAPRRVVWTPGDALDLRELLACIPEPKQTEPPPRVEPRATPNGSNILKRASAYLATCEPSIEKKGGGGGGHNSLLHAASVLVLGFSLPHDVALSMLESEFNPRCTPTWTKKELAHKVESAAKQGKMVHGCLIGDGRTAESEPTRAAEAPIPTAEKRDEKPADVKLPEILITPDQEDVTRQALDALKNEPIWVRNHGLVEILYDSVSDPKRKISRPLASPVIRSIPVPKLQARISARAIFLRAKGNEYVRACAPPYIGVVALAQGSRYPFDNLECVTETPMQRPDGSILETPGYDKETGYFYAPNANYPTVKSDATREDALKSLAKLFVVIQDFPFATDADKSAWLAGLLTPFARTAFSGPAPIFVTEASSPSSGKTRLASYSAEIFLGRKVARCPQSDDPEEEKRRITSMLIEGDRVVLFDNATRLGGPVMDALATSTAWKDRVLGASKTTGDLPINLIIHVTGNNMQKLGDVIRRLCVCTLESKLQNPEDRGDFKIPDLNTYVEEHRVELAVACLTILRAYHMAGRPKHNLVAWGSFEAWSSIIREFIVWLGLPDCTETRKELRASSDVTVNAIGEFLLGWIEACDLQHGVPLPGMPSKGITTAQAETLLRKNTDSLLSLRSAIAELGPPRKTNASPTSRELGFIIRKIKKRPVKSMRICGSEYNHLTVWNVEQLPGEGADTPIGADTSSRQPKSSDDNYPSGAQECFGYHPAASAPISVSAPFPANQYDDSEDDDYQIAAENEHISKEQRLASMRAKAAAMVAESKARLASGHA